MANLGNFNASEVDPAFGFDPIPAGKYLAVITDSELKQTKSGAGHFLEITFQIIEGEHKDRLVWSRLNLENANATAVKIAHAELSAICRAVGVMTPKESVELHNLPLIITVAHKKRADTGEITNVIKSYAKKDSVAAAATPGGGKPPWAK